MEGLQIRSYGSTSQCNLNMPAAFHSVNREIYSRKIKKTLSLQHYYFNKASRKATCGKFYKPNQTKKSLYFKYQCLFWSSFCTMQVEGSMLRFDQNVKIFSCGVFGFFVGFLVWFFLRNMLNAHISFLSIKKPIVVKDKRAEDQVHCCSMPVLEITAQATT